MSIVRIFLRSGVFSILLLLSTLCIIKTTAIEPLEGGAINFQGFMVDDQGVPFGTAEEERFYLRFSITSENPSAKTWESNPILVSVQNGVFSVRLGKFDEETAPLDESIFSGDEENKRFLRIEICDPQEGGCLPYSDSRYADFSRKFDLNDQDLNSGLVENFPPSQITIPGVPFVVSSLRLV